MDKAKRKAIIAGNWKMNKTASEAAVLVDELIPAVKDASCEVVICTPYTDLVTAVAKTKGTNIHVGAENVHFEKSGAFTGEISADMLVDLGVEYVIVGHSERRQYFAETDQTVNKRALAALNAGLKVILCVGETLEQAVDYAKSIYGTDDIIWYNNQGGRRPHAVASFPVLSGNQDARLRAVQAAADSTQQAA